LQFFIAEDAALWASRIRLARLASESRIWYKSQLRRSQAYLTKRAYFVMIVELALKREKNLVDTRFFSPDVCAARRLQTSCDRIGEIAFAYFSSRCRSGERHGRKE
jgi:hypothetical protein